MYDQILERNPLWFRFPILKPSFGHTLVCRYESLKNLLANQFHHNLFACTYSIPYVSTNQLQRPNFFLIVHSIKDVLFITFRLSVYCLAFWNVNDIRYPIWDISSGFIMLFLFVRFFYYFWYVDIGTLENCFLLGISWQNVFFKFPLIF